MAKIYTYYHRGPCLQEQNCPDWSFPHLWNKFAAVKSVLLCVAALKVAIATSFEGAPMSICFENIGVLFPYGFLPASSLLVCEPAVVVRSTKKKATLSQTERIRCANDAGHGFAPTEQPPDRS
jgi:hypothetical protein